ncbi:hypothetical protein WN093_03495 [Gammaproteobacteria bacterium AS21]|jgi:hypothetical protein
MIMSVASQLIVEKVEFYADEAATVTLNNGYSSIEAFCYPCDYKVGDKVDNLLRVLEANVKSAYLLDWPEEVIEQASQERIEKTATYSYVGCAKVTDEKKGIITVNGFRIEVGAIACSGAVAFEFSRLDLW